MYMYASRPTPRTVTMIISAMEAAKHLICMQGFVINPHALGIYMVGWHACVLVEIFVKSFAKFGSLIWFHLMSILTLSTSNTVAL